MRKCTNHFASDSFEVHRVDKTAEAIVEDGQTFLLGQRFTQHRCFGAGN